MSTKKEIKNYIKESLKKGYSKEQIKEELLKSYSEKEFIRYLIERPEPKLLEEHKKAQIWLIIFVVGALIFRFITSFLEGMGMGEERGMEWEIGLQIGIGLIAGFISIILLVLVFIGLVKGSAWSYVVFFVYGILNLLYSIPSLLMAFFEEIPAEYMVDATLIRITAIIMVLIGFVIYLGITILSRYCWKKIHPIYKIKNLFVASS